MTVLDDAPGLPDSNNARRRAAELHTVREAVLAGPSEKATEAQHAKGKLTARERIDLLLDEGSFNELEPLRRHQSQASGWRTGARTRTV